MIQSLVTQVLIKNKVILDQLRKGLSILGLLSKIEAYPQIFAELFVHSEVFCAQRIKELLTIDDCNDQASVASCDMFIRFLDGATHGQLRQFLMFATGTEHAGSLEPGAIQVSFLKCDAIYASTCLMEVKILISVDSYEQFKAAMENVIVKDTFTTP